MSKLAFIKTKLKLLLNQMDSNPAEFIQDREKDFTRSRKISFKSTLSFLLFLQGNSLNKELQEFFPSCPSLFTSSAMLQQRSKVKPSAFQYLLRNITSSCQENRSFFGYQLLAVDGSDFSIPPNPKEKDCYFQKKKERKGYSLLHVNTLYNLLDKVYEEVCIQPGKKKNEHQALVQMLLNSLRKNNVIVVADRGYESYNTFAHIIEKGWDFVIRARQGGSTILHWLNLPEEEEYDETIKITLTKTSKKQEIENPGYLKRLWSTVKFDFLDNDTLYYTLTLRVVRIKVSESLTEVLFTSLPKETMSAERVREIYKMRWGIETSYRNLKYNIGAAAIHSKKEVYATQEVYAKIVIYNCCELMTSKVTVPDLHRKHTYQVNFSMASFICIKYLKPWSHMTASWTEYLILRYLEPIRPGRTYKRITRPKSAICFQYRIP